MKRRALTLIEVLVAISIAAVLTLGIERLLTTALTAWRLATEEVAISGLSEETMRGLMEGDYDLPGIRDAVEMIDVQEDSITFVPLWLDIFDPVPKDGTFYLSKRLRPGAPTPLGEVKFRGARQFATYFGTVRMDQTGKPWFDFGFPIQRGSAVQLSYQPDVRVHPELAMTYKWDKKAQRITRFYRDEVTHFNLRHETIKTTSFRFTYLDGSNRPVDITGKKLSTENALIRITAVRVELKLEGAELTKEATSLANIRALGKAGQGIILSRGLDIPIPDSANIRLMQLLNFTGVDEGHVIEVKVHAPRAKYEWRLKLLLGIEGNIPVLRRYEIYYPTNKQVGESEPG